MGERSAATILAAVSEAYRAFLEYEDRGTVDGGPPVRFETRFRRGVLFHFSYDAMWTDTYQPQARVTRDVEGLSFWTVFKGAPQPSSLGLALAALTGVSGGAAHGVSSLLMPDEV